MDGGELTKTVTLWLLVNSLDSGGYSKETLEKSPIQQGHFFLTCPFKIKKKKIGNFRNRNRVKKG